MGLLPNGSLSTLRADQWLDLGQRPAARNPEIMLHLETQPVLRTLAEYEPQPLRKIDADGPALRQKRPDCAATDPQCIGQLSL